MWLDKYGAGSFRLASRLYSTTRDTSTIVLRVLMLFDPGCDWLGETSILTESNERALKVREKFEL